ISSINQSKNEIRVTLFPNPVLDQLAIETKQIDFQGEISIYNIRGILIDKRKISDPVTHLDFSMMKPGIYIVKVADNEYIKTFKLVKQ
ncbi:MAG: T9SS type A sorting domain-containing protein, partial [Bacteroidia bacterium]|nr:T9SS type A sorting domain-containing protein [Bacteroidia bacterium]